MRSSIRVRFAPSPTGYLHVGGARTALFNYLFAKRMGGTFILRIEDTDRSRYQEDACKEIYESLQWLGITWDEGPDVGGAYGSYVQSERVDLYRKHAQQLLESGHAYRCFCTPQRLEELRNYQEKNKLDPGYDKQCRNLPAQESARLLAENTPHIIRLKIPQDRVVAFNDLIRGAIEYKSAVLDDLVLMKTDGFPTYHLANVVDDHAMEISHVLRGDEWIASTPRHVLLYEAFGWTPPIFAHMPVILSADGGKLSKRKGAASVLDYKNQGYLPEALFNFLALLGWSLGDGDEREKLSQEELISVFSLGQVSPKASVFDEKKLEWMNGLYMRERTSISLAELVVPFWKQKGWVPNATPVSDTTLVKVIDLLKERSKKIVDMVESATYFFIAPVQYEEKAVRKYFVPDAIKILADLCELLSKAESFEHAALEALYKNYGDSLGIAFGVLIHPTRLAVSGVSFGPGLFELLEVLGKEQVCSRLQTAIAFIQNAVATRTES